MQRNTWNMNFAEFFEEYAGASFEEINTWLALSGYNLYHHDVQASIFVDDGDLYGSDNIHAIF